MCFRSPISKMAEMILTLAFPHLFFANFTNFGVFRIFIKGIYTVAILWVPNKITWKTGNILWPRNQCKFCLIWTFNWLMYEVKMIFKHNLHFILKVWKYLAFLIHLKITSIGKYILWKLNILSFFLKYN